MPHWEEGGYAEEKLSSKVEYIRRSRNLIGKSEEFFMCCWSNCWGLYRGFQKKPRGNGESIDAGVGEGVEAIMIEQGGDKHHHLGHDMEAMLMNMCTRDRGWLTRRLAWQGRKVCVKGLVKNRTEKMTEKQHTLSYGVWRIFSKMSN